jgi:hypothetical protein
MKLGIVMASRGTMFSKTMESVFNNIKNFPEELDYNLYMAHGRPIPDCFNEPLDKALSEGCDYIWFVEEDMLLPPDTLHRLWATTESVVTVDYADRRTGIPLILRDVTNRVVFSGMGCMLVKREVFEKMSPPYLKCMEVWKITEDNGDVRWEPQPNIKSSGYGKQDIYFCWAVRNVGYEIAELKDANIGHMSLMSKAEDIQNNGGDTIKTVFIPTNGNTNQK